MTRLRQHLEGSLLAGVIAKVEKGEDVDLRRVLALQALETARAGELFLLDALDAEDENDGFLERFARQESPLRGVSEG